MSDARLRFDLATYDANGDQYFLDNVVLEKTGAATTTLPPVTYGPADYLKLLQDWMKTDSPADVNDDNIVNSRDLGIMMSRWGR